MTNLQKLVTIIGLISFFSMSSALAKTPSFTNEFSCQDSLVNAVIGSIGKSEYILSLRLSPELLASYMEQAEQIGGQKASAQLAGDNSFGLGIMLNPAGNQLTCARLTDSTYMCVTVNSKLDPQDKISFDIFLSDENYKRTHFVSCY